MKWKLLGLRTELSIADAAEFVTCGNGSEELLALILDSVECGDLRADVKRYHSYWPAETEINPRQTMITRADLDSWLDAKGLSVVPSLQTAPTTPAPASEPVTPAAEAPLGGVTTAQIVEAFDGLVTFNLGKAMTDGAAWTVDARIARGTKGGRHKSIWNPVVMATALHARNNAPMPKLNQAFYTYNFLADWREEWNRLSTM
ncbi:MAG: hypothetical protein H7173_11970 [Rhodoferax sp.]|nr:hypothetical protein [Pseudorhodobacter sp.]